MPAIDVSLSTLFTDLPFVERFRAAADLDLPHVEFRWPFDGPVADSADIDELARAVTAAGVTVVAISAWPGPSDAVGVLHRYQHDAMARAHLESLLRLADRVDCELINTLGGAGPVHALIDELCDVAERLEQHGRRLAVEPVNATEFPGAALKTLSAASQVVHRLRERGVQNVWVLADLYHELAERQRIGGDVVAELRAALPYVGHVQLADTPDRRRPDPAEAPWPTLLAILTQFYSGSICCEWIPAGASTEAGEFEWIREMPRDGVGAGPTEVRAS